MKGAPPPASAVIARGIVEKDLLEGFAVQVRRLPHPPPPSPLDPPAPPAIRLATSISAGDHSLCKFIAFNIVFAVSCMLFVKEA